MLLERWRTLPSGLLLSAFLALGAAQVPFLGPCTPVTTVPKFDVSRYMGRWFEAERYFNLMEFAGRCVTTNFSAAAQEGDAGTDRDPPQLIAVTDQTSWLTEIQSTIKGQMRPLDRKGDPAKMYTRYQPMELTMNHWVLDTDYGNYAVVYSCTDIGSVLSTRNAWILTRARHPPLDVMERAYAAIDKNHISRAFFIRVDQSEKNCVDQKAPAAPASHAAATSNSSYSSLLPLFTLARANVM